MSFMSFLKEFETNLHSIDVLDLTYDTRQELKKRGYNTIADISNSTHKSMSWANVDPWALRELEKEMKRKGIHYKN